MQIVIEISDTLKGIADDEDTKTFSHIVWQAVLMDAIKNGTPLPKGHGRLIDADVLEEKLHRYTEAPYQYAMAVFNESPTIIEAEKS